MWFLGGERQGTRDTVLGGLIRRRSAGAEMAGQVAMVKRSTLLACMTCPLCHRLLKEATTISLCLHTFCRDCIYGQFSDEEEDRCPVCNIDLGCQPVEKLRPDHNLQDIVAKLFPETRKTYAPEFNPPSEVTVSPGETQSPEVTPSIPSPVRRKERSLSSLVVSTPKVSTQTGLTGKRSKALTRKAAALRGCGFSAEEPTEDHPMSSSSTESRERHKMEDSPYPDDKNEVEVVEGKADLWTPLNCLVEAANRTKSSKSNSQGALDALNALKLYNMSENKEEDSTNTLDSDVSMTETKKKEVELSAKGKNNSNGAGAPVRRRKSRAANHTKTDLMDSSASAQAMLDANGDQDNRRNCPIWFSLISSENWKGDSPLPQISAGYLRIKDGKMRVSHIQKYVAKKLDLKSEDEVEIMCRGQPVLPSLELESLVDLWLRTAPTQKRVPAVVGSSAKDFVMVLSYCRRVEAPGDNQ